jgi:hypothetical protein
VSGKRKRTYETKGELGGVLGSSSTLSEGVNLDPLDLDLLVLGNDKSDASAGVTLELSGVPMKR